MRNQIGRDELKRAGQTAHIHAAHFTKTWDHGVWFIKSYMAIERVMLGFGFRPLLTDALRFAGCPPGSPAAKLQGIARQSKSLEIRV